MGRKYVKTKQIVNEVLKYQEEGKTYREIGKIYGLSVKQITNLLYRHRNTVKKLSGATIPLKRKGRPRKKPITTQREMELEIRKLKMENDLLRDFLQSIGRR